MSFKLPAGSQVIHIGGWKKLESEKVDKKTFNQDIAHVLGISPDNVIDIYGFTEQMGLNYPDCKAGWKHVHAYSDVIIRDEADLSPCPNGVVGLLEFVSPLQHSYPGNVVLTDDLGVVEDSVCFLSRGCERACVLCVQGSLGSAKGFAKLRSPSVLPSDYSLDEWIPVAILGMTIGLSSSLRVTELTFGKLT